MQSLPTLTEKALLGMVVETAVEPKRKARVLQLLPFTSRYTGTNGIEEMGNAKKKQ